MCVCVCVRACACVCARARVVNRQLMVSSDFVAAEVKPIKKIAIACEFEFVNRRIMMGAGPRYLCA